MSADEKENEALRLLVEVAEERHGDRCAVVHVELVDAGGRLLELIDRGVSRSAASCAPPVSPAVACG